MSRKTIGKTQQHTIAHVGKITDPRDRPRFLHAGHHIVGWQARSGRAWIIMPLHGWRQAQLDREAHARMTLSLETIGERR